eukprot:4057113-Alexandrium_andersonii.AAC.1
MRSVRFGSAEEQEASEQEARETWSDWCEKLELPIPRRVISIHRSLSSEWSDNSPRSPRSPGAS